MRIPFLRRKQPESLKGIASRVTYVPSHEVATPPIRDTRTFEEIRAATARRKRLLNGDPPS
jgi:hypothetical protein